MSQFGSNLDISTGAKEHKLLAPALLLLLLQRSYYYFYKGSKSPPPETRYDSDASATVALEQERVAKRQRTTGDDLVSANEAPMESAPLQECCCCVAWKAGADTTYRCLQDRPETHDVALRVDIRGKAGMKDAAVQASTATQQAATHNQGSSLGRTAVDKQVNFQQVYAAMTCAVQTESWVPSFPVLPTRSLLSPAPVVTLLVASLLEEDLDPGQEMDKDWTPLSEQSEDDMRSRDHTIEPGSPLQDEKNYVVFEGCLLELFTICRTCLMKCEPSLTVKGTLVKVETICKDAHYHTWSSQPVIKGKAAGSLLLSSAIFFSGASPTATLRCDVFV
ncbi:uncharacterized protein LOC115309883 [Ixodes scapularis]|uniref:uncharacterized protein LOC115309883 n=1 Tax=Ixodes scapularis TaxID=6945 RepID=UPI001C38C25D|nr:uncharacterized protein LOC115309883 [Ixodes scapularis]